MKKLMITALALVSVAWFINGSGAKGKFHPKQNPVVALLDSVPDSPKKAQWVSYMLDSVPDSPKKKIQQFVNYKYDSVPDSPKKINLIAMR
jgi:hypothetical protein